MVDLSFPARSLLCRLQEGGAFKKFIARLQRILLPKMPFFVCQKVHISSKILPQSQILPVFCHPKMRPFQQCITVTAVNLFYEVLSKQFEAFGFCFSQGKKQVTAEYWVTWTVAFFAWNHTVSWQIIHHYMLECHMVKLMTYDYGRFL